MRGTKIGYPVPAENAFYADNDIVQIREKQFEQYLWIRIDVFVNHGFPFLVEDANIHFPGMQVDAAVVLMLLVIKFHFASFAVRVKRYADILL